MDKVLPMIGRLGSDSEAGDMTHSMSAIYGAVARAAGLRGEWTLSRKYMKLCLDAITNELNVPSADDDDHDAVDVDPGQEQEGGKKRSQTSKQVVVGGKRAWKEMDVSREHSLIVRCVCSCSRHVLIYLVACRCIENTKELNSDKTCNF